MAQPIIDPTSRTIRINLARETYRQSSSVGVDGVVNRQRQLVRVQRVGADITLTYFDSHSLRYIIKTVRNIDSETEELKYALIGPVTWNAQKVLNFRGESDSRQLRDEEKAKITIENTPTTDMDWKSDVRFYGIRDALLGEVSYRTRER